MQQPELLIGIEFDKAHDECGIVAVVSHERDAALVATQAVSTLENRGREATGVSVMLSDTVVTTRGFGTAADVFPDMGRGLSETYPVTSALAHARYSTQGTQTIEAAQPHAYERTKNHKLDSSHVQNGNLINTQELANRHGILDNEYHTDSQLAGLLITNAVEQRIASGLQPTTDLIKEAVRDTIKEFEGAFLGAIQTKYGTVVYSDHHGIKPGVVGMLPQGGVIVASEVTSLDEVGAYKLRDVEAGQLVVIEPNGDWYVEQWAEPEPKHCVMELLYFIKPRGKHGTRASFGGLDIEDARRNAGRALAEVSPVNTDIVFGIPNSAVPAGEGYAETSGIDYEPTAITANKTARSFILPTQEEREEAVKNKLNVGGVVDGKTGVAVEDSLIRGTTARKIVQMLFAAGMEEVHLRIALPEYAFICDRGVDTSDPDELVAANMSVEKIRELIGASSLAFLTVDLLDEKVLGDRADDFCKGCLTGEYPTLTPQVVPSEVEVALTSRK